MDCAQVRPLLPAFLDGETVAAGEAGAPDAALRIAQHLETCADCAALAARQRALGQDLRQALPLRAPPALRARIAALAAPPAAAASVPATPAPLAPAEAPQPPRPLRLLRHLPTVIAAGLAAVTAWSVASWWYGPGPRDLLVHDLVAAHVRALLPGHGPDVLSSDHHTVKPWFTGRLDYAPWVEDLAEQGFPLRGGRVDFIAGQRVAVLVYQRGLHTIDLLVAPPGLGADGLARTVAEGYNVFAWTAQGQGFVAISDASLEELKALGAAAVRGQDGPRPGVDGGAPGRTP